MMSKYTFIIALFLLLSNCTTPKDMTYMHSMEDMDYGKMVNHIQLKNDIDLAYIEEGDANKETILFIHGLGSYIPAWNNNIKELKNTYRCIAIDLPGYGKSSKGNYPISMDFFADIVRDFCQKKNIQHLVLAGHSMGGQIAISTALKYPELVSKLILIAPAGFETFTIGEREWFRNVMSVEAVRLTSVEQIRTNFAYNFYDMPDDAKFMIDDRIAMRSASDFTAYCQHIVSGVSAMVDSPINDFLPNIKQPSLVVFGAQDNLIPNRYLHGGKTEKYAKMGADKMPNAKLSMVNHAGHFVMFEKAGEVNTLILDFMKK